MIFFAVFSSIFLRGACGAWFDAARALLQDAGGSHRERFDAARALLQDAGGPSHRGPQSGSGERSGPAIERDEPVVEEEQESVLNSRTEETTQLLLPAHDGLPTQLPLPAHDGLHLTGLTSTSAVVGSLTAQNLRAHQLQFASPNTMSGTAEVAAAGSPANRERRPADVVLQRTVFSSPTTYQVLAKDPQLLHSLSIDQHLEINQFDWLFSPDDVGRPQAYHKRQRERGWNWKPMLHRMDRVDIFVTGWGWVAEKASTSGEKKCVNKSRDSAAASSNAENGADRATAQKPADDELGCWSYVQSPRPVARGVPLRKKLNVLRIVEVFDWRSWAAEPPHFWLPVDKAGFQIRGEGNQYGVWYILPAPSPFG